jgi:RNA polymerase sigma factor (sigma-70 family)
MPSSRETLLRYIRRSASIPATDELSDGALLDRFIAERDQRAFAALAERHGAMVLQTCRWVLGNADDAEDAFQGTFLVLARKAAVIHPRESLAAWLRSVARRVALNIRAARIRYHESGSLLQAPADRRAGPLAELSAREVLAIMDEEVQRLPEQYRLPIILCCLNGLTLEEAARQLGWTTGSVKGRLERGRARLHDRLMRRGLTFAATLAIVEASRATASTVGLAGLAARTIPGALAFAAGQGMVSGISTSAAAVAGRVGRAMALPRFTMAAVLLVTTAALGAGVALYHKSPEENRSNHTALATRHSPPATPDLPEPFWDQSDVPIDVKGQVLDPRGKPVAGAELYVGYSGRRLVRHNMQENALAEQPRPESCPRRATTDADGRFQFRFATSELDPPVLDHARPAVMAIAAGYGPDWVEIGPSAVGDLKLQLVSDLPVSGRVLDADRRPVAGAKLVVQGIYSAPVDELTRFLKGDYVTGWAPRCWKGPLPGNTSAILTDADGRWRSSGLGRDRIAVFALDGPGVPPTFLNVATRSAEEAFHVTHVHGPTFDYMAPRARTIRGTVRDQVTREPIVGVRVTVRPGNATVRTGPDGRFEVLEGSKSNGYGLVAQPEAGQGYFANQACARVEGSGAELTQDLFLGRGIVLSGKVTNQSVTKPPKSAVVEYYPLASNQHTRGISCTGLVPASATTVRPDGTYSMSVLPGPGIVAVAASPREDYAVADFMNREWADVMNREWADVTRQRFDGMRADASGLEPSVPIALAFGQPGLLPINKYHALALIHPSENARQQVQDLPLRTGQTVVGTVLGPDAQPLGGVQVIGLTALRDGEVLEGASFTVTGLNPRASRELFFQHRGKKLGKVVTVGGNTTRPVTVKLERCGTVKGRLVDERGNAMQRANVCLGEEASPGYTMAQTDHQGRFEIDLFPGQKYSWGFPYGLQTQLGTVQVESGQNKDLGELVLTSGKGR